VQVKIVDLNILLYAVNSDAGQHERVHRWWEAAVNDEETVGIAWIVLLGFLRLATNTRVFPRPLAPDVAAAKLDAWFAQDNVRIVREKDDHWEQLKRSAGCWSIATRARCGLARASPRKRPRESDAQARSLLPAFRRRSCSPADQAR
jgi:toxin-antitoxin system PIN domain toxin